MPTWERKSQIRINRNDQFFFGTPCIFYITLALLLADFRGNIKINLNFSLEVEHFLFQPKAKLDIVSLMRK